MGAKITTIDNLFTKLPNVRWVNLNGNKLTSLNAKNHPKLNVLRVNKNQLTSLQLGNNPLLYILTATYNSNLQEVTTEGSLPILGSFDAFNSAIKKVSNLGTPSTLMFSAKGTMTEAISFTANPNLFDVRIYEATGLSFTNYDTNNLNFLVLQSNTFTSQLDISKFTSLKYLTLSSTNQTSVSLNSSNLEYVYVGFNPLTSVTIAPAALTKLDQITFYDCGLTASVVDSILVSMANTAVTNGFIDLSGASNAAPTATGLAAKSTLQGKGWLVVHK